MCFERICVTGYAVVRLKNKDLLNDKPALIFSPPLFKEDNVSK